MIKRFLTDFPPSSEPQVAMEAATNTDIASLHVLKHVCVWLALWKTLSACITAEPSKREQNPAGFRMSPFIRRSVTGGKPWEPKLCFKWDCNCWGHYPFTLKPFFLCLYVCLNMCVHTCVSMPMCVCPSPALKALGASGSCEKSILFGSSASLFI